MILLHRVVVDMEEPSGWKWSELPGRLKVGIALRYHRLRSAYGGPNRWKWGLPLSLLIVALAVFAVIACFMTLAALFVKWISRLTPVALYLGAGLVFL